MKSTFKIIGRTFIALFLMTAVHGALASHFDAGDQVIIKNPIDGNAYLSGGTVEIEAIITGDLITAGGELHIRDSVYQDILAAGGNVDLYQYVGGDVRVTGGSVRIYRTVEGDLVVMGGDVQIEKDARVGGDLIVFAGSVRVDGTIQGKVNISGGNVTLNGTINGQTEVNAGSLRINGAITGPSTFRAESLRLGDQASFSSDVAYWSSQKQDFTPYMQSGAQATYDESLKETDFDFDWMTLGLGAIIFFILRLIAAFIIIVFTLLLLRSYFRRATLRFDQEWMRSIGFGLLYLFILPIVSVILMLTVVGLPLGLFSLGFYGLSMLILPSLAAVLAAFALEKYYNAQWGYGRLLMVSLGMYIIFRILMLIPLLNILIWIIVIAWGTGTIINGMSGRRELSATDELT